MTNRKKYPVLIETAMMLSSAASGGLASAILFPKYPWIALGCAIIAALITKVLIELDK